MEVADGGRAVAGPFALGIGVMHIEAEARFRTGTGPLQHLQIAIRIAECANARSSKKALGAGGFDCSVRSLFFH